MTDGVLEWGDIDEKYALSFVFKGSFVPRLVAADGTELRPDGGGLTRGVDEEGDPTTEGQFSGVALVDDQGAQAVYELLVDEDEGAEAASRAAQGGARGFRREPAGGGGCVTSGSAALTRELKGMSVDELREGGERYKALLEARDLEDVLYGSG